MPGPTPGTIMPRLNPLAARIGWLVTITNPQASRKCSKKVLLTTNSQPFSHRATQPTMKTPITDAGREVWMMKPNVTLGDGREISGNVVDADLARKLELDRAALMDALTKIAHNPGDCDNETGFTSGHVARAALSAALANFPD